MNIPLCHRTIGPSMPNLLPVTTSSSAATLEWEYLVPPPRPCIGSACTLWCVNVDRTTLGRCADNPHQERFLDPAAPVKP